MKITVTQEDIEKAGVRDFNCPIALALKRETGLVASVWKNGIDLFFSEEDKYHYSDRHLSLNFTEEMKAFILSYDESGKSAVKPTTFIF